MQTNTNWGLAQYEKKKKKFKSNQNCFFFFPMFALIHMYTRNFGRNHKK